MDRKYGVDWTAGKAVSAEKFNGYHALVGHQVELCILNEARQVGNNQQPFVLKPAHKSEDAGIVVIEDLDAAAAEGFEFVTKGNQPSHPPQDGVGVALLDFYIDDLAMIFGRDDYRQKEFLGVSLRESRIPVGAPLHRRPDSVSIAEVDVIAHADFVALIDDRRPRQ